MARLEGDGRSRHKKMAGLDRRWHNSIDEMAGQERRQQDQKGDGRTRQEMAGLVRRWQDHARDGSSDKRWQD
jgi:hypothetical protein